MNSIVFYLYYSMIGMVYATMVAACLYVGYVVVKTLYLIVRGKAEEVIEATTERFDRISRIRRAKRIARRRARRHEQKVYESMLKEVKM